MKLKKYIEFIKESVEEKIDRRYDVLDKETIKGYFIYLEDANWSVYVNYGYIDENNDWCSFLIPNIEYRPGYEIEIYHQNKATDEDVTDYFITGFNIIKDILKDDNIKLKNGGVEYDISEIKFKEIVIVDNGNIINGIDIYTSNSNIKLKFTEKEIAEHYKWKEYIVDKNDNIYLDIEIGHLCNLMLGENDSYSEILINRGEDMWDHYYDSDYTPDKMSVIRYSLDVENTGLLIKALIKEAGGWSVLKEESIVTDLDEEFQNENEFTKFILDERSYTTLGEMCEGEIWDETKQIVNDHEMNAHVSKNYENIVASFDKMLNDEGLTYTKFDKDYTEYYRISFSNEWVNEWEEEENILIDVELYDIFEEYCGNMYFNNTIEPDFDDYGDVDYKDMNKDIKSLLKSI